MVVARRALGAALALAVIVTLVFALLPQPPSVLAEAGDKVRHMLAFAVLTLLAVGYFGVGHFARIFLALATFGGMIEVMQLAPSLQRSAEWFDWAADCCAVLSALLLCRVGALVAHLAGEGP